MTIKPGKRTISYVFESPMTLADIRQLVKQTEDVDGAALFKFNVTSDQREGTTSYRVTIEESRE
jgi:hypothetical protein